MGKFKAYSTARNRTGAAGTGMQDKGGRRKMESSSGEQMQLYGGYLLCTVCLVPHPFGNSPSTTSCDSASPQKNSYMTHE
jgi:hypothetical protein